MEGIFISHEEIRGKVLNLKNKFLELFNEFLKNNPAADFTKAYGDLEKLNRSTEFNNDYFKILLFTLTLTDEPISGSQLRSILISEGLMTEGPYGKLVATIRDDNNRLIRKLKMKGSKGSIFHLDSSVKGIIMNLGREANLSVEGAIVRISSYRPLPESSYPFCFDLDFFKAFKQEKPQEEEWENVLKKFKELRRILLFNLSDVTIQPYYPHQSLGFLLGHVLGGFNIKIHQRNNYAEKELEFWYNTPSTERLKLDLHWEIAKSAHFNKAEKFSISEIALIINVSTVISSLVKKFLHNNQPNLPYVDFHIAAGVRNTCLQNTVDASKKIEAIEFFLNEIMKEHPLTNIHLFWRAPFSFAVMLGQKLRKRWICHVYERKGLTQDYYFAVRLE